MTKLLSGNSVSLSKNVLWNTIGSVFYQGCLWLMTVLVVRLSSDYQNSGALAFAMSVGNIYTAIGTYTMRTYQVSDVNGKYCASNYVALRIVTVLGGLLICCIYGLAVSPSFSTTLVICAFLLFKADEAFVNVLYGCDQIAMRLDYVGISQILRGIICVGVFSLGMLFTNHLAITLLLVFASCIVITVAYDMPRANELVDTLSPQITRTQCLNLLRDCLPTVVGNVVGGLVVSTARQYFGNAYGEESLGIYASVATPCVIIQVLAQNLYTPLLGPIAEQYRRGSCLAASKAAVRLLLLVAGVALVTSLSLSLAAEPLLTLIYGESITPYVNVLPPALLVMTGVATTAVICDLLIVLDHLKTTLAVNGIAFAVSVLLVSPCTTAWYMNGLNASLIIAYAVAVVFGISQVLWRSKQPWSANDDTVK